MIILANFFLVVCRALSSFSISLSLILFSSSNSFLVDTNLISWHAGHLLLLPTLHTHFAFLPPSLPPALPNFLTPRRPHLHHSSPYTLLYQIMHHAIYHPKH